MSGVFETQIAANDPRHLGTVPHNRPGKSARPGVANPPVHHPLYRPDTPYRYYAIRVNLALIGTQTVGQPLLPASDRYRPRHRRSERRRATLQATTHQMLIKTG
jgi:hypothetical protein